MIAQLGKEILSAIFVLRFTFILLFRTTTVSPVLCVSTQKIIGVFMQGHRSGLGNENYGSPQRKKSFQCNLKLGYF